MDEWKLFKEELPTPKKHILIKKEYNQTEILEYEELEEYEKVIYSVGYLKAGILYMGDVEGSLEIDITNEEIRNNYYWKYI